MIVRRMRPDEIDITVNLCRYYHQEAAEAIPELAEQWDTNSVIKTIRQRSINPALVWLNMYEGSRPVGFISGSFNTAPWNDGIVISAIDMFYILPSHRNIENFRDLYKNYEEYARMVNTTKVFVSDMGVNPDRTNKLYEHFGFERTTSLIKDI